MPKRSRNPPGLAGYRRKRLTPAELDALWPVRAMTSAERLEVEAEQLATRPGPKPRRKRRARR